MCHLDISHSQGRPIYCRVNACTCHQNRKSLTIINLNSTMSFPVLKGSSILYNFRILKFYVALGCRGILILVTIATVQTLTARVFGGFDHKGRDVRRDFMPRVEFHSCEILEYRLQKAAFSVDPCAIGARVLGCLDFFLCGLIGSEHNTREARWHKR